MKRMHCLAAVLALSGSLAHAANSIDLSSYTVTGNYALDRLGTLGLEASAITYARDRNSLFFVGDEGEGVVEVSLTGQTLSSMRFSGWPAATRHNDAEGLTYLGGGMLVVAEERLQDAFLFSYVPGGSVSLASAPWASISDYGYANNGIEGISYDPRDGSFVSVKQDSPLEVRAGTLSFAAGGGISTMTPLFDASALGLSTLSDVQTLSPIDALAGTAAADNLLVLSLGSRMLLEIDRAGNTLSRFDLSGITSQAIEGVTVDELGRIYLVAEDSGTPNSRLFVLSPVPEPDTWAMMLVGLAGMGYRLRRRKA
ncbi:MAG: PEP-CTERM sorting domain-containing protein [Proteobacteria bacterium]|nr:MAG: PEP-CTERM sorting domain-containing protein [Pseudomonadota bacterium]